jgi:hypothetical protein
MAVQKVEDISWLSRVRWWWFLSYRTMLYIRGVETRVAAAE